MLVIFYFLRWAVATQMLSLSDHPLSSIVTGFGSFTCVLYFTYKLGNIVQRNDRKNDVIESRTRIV